VPLVYYLVMLAIVVVLAGSKGNPRRIPSLAVALYIFYM
jgi:hypothetical protein